jgi:hypothetical protein
MADLNALIAQGAQFRVPPPVDPMGNMPQLMQMQSMQQQNQMNQMKMQESQRGQQEMNALRGLMSSPDFDLSTPASQRRVYELAPTQAESILKGYYGNLKTAAEVKNLDFTGQKTKAEAAAERAKLIGQAGRDINSRPDDENLISYDRDIQSSPLFTPEEKQAAADKTQRLLAMSMADRTEFLSQQGATAGELRPQVVAPGASLVAPGANTPYFTAPATPAAPTKSIGSVSPGDFTPASLAKFNVSGNYGDLVPKPVDRAPRSEAAVRTQQVTLEDGSLGIVNMDTGVITRSTVGGAPVKGKDATKTGLSEQQAASNIGRLLTAANEIKDITGKDPSAMKPGATEALASSVGMSGTANLARSANRQIVQGAQRDALDALLYLATGAAYNKEQLLGQMEAYIPAFTDTAKTVAAKQTRMANLIQSAKTRAGKAWTPEMDAAMKALMSPSKVTPDAKAMPVPTGVDPALWGAMTPEEQKLWEK